MLRHPSAFRAPSFIGPKDIGLQRFRVQPDDSPSLGDEDG
jgi:hypothetical protein